MIGARERGDRGGGLHRDTPEMEAVTVEGPAKFETASSDRTRKRWLQRDCMEDPGDDVLLLRPRLVQQSDCHKHAKTRPVKGRG